MLSKQDFRGGYGNACFVEIGFCKTGDPNNPLRNAIYHALIPGLASQIATSAGEGYEISGNCYGSCSLSIQNVSQLVWPPNCLVMIM